MKKIAVLFLSIFLLINFIPSSSSDTIYVREGESIQAAVDAALPGSRIVIEGEFHETIVVNKSIILEGRNAFIYGDNNGTVIHISSSNVILRNISISQSDAFNPVVGIDGHAVVERCSISCGRYGIKAGKDAIISECNITECGTGIVINDGNMIQSCSMYKCGIGIECYGDDNHILSCHVTTCGVALYMQNASSNTIEKCSFYKNNNNEVDIFMLQSNNNVIKDCDIGYVSFAIRMLSCESNLIYNSTIHDARYGMEYERCNNCYVEHSSIINNRFGVSMMYSRKIVFRYNDFKSKMYNIEAKFSYCDARHNYWNAFHPVKIKNEGSVILKTPWEIERQNYILPLFHYKAPENKNVKHGEMKANHHSFHAVSMDDFDPMVDIKVIFILSRVRSMDGRMNRVVVSIDGKRNTSAFGEDDFCKWKAIQNVDDSKQIVDIRIRVGSEIAEIHYDLATGNWYGDDMLGDGDGYGHIVMKKHEIWFDVKYNDYDGDGLTYWEEMHIYHTNPAEDDSMGDYDGDGIPFWWEDKYGFNPLSYNNFSCDNDSDGLSNLQEYYMASNLSHPFSKDIFFEVDYMHGYSIKKESIEIIYNAFASHNITMHIFVDDEIPSKIRLYYNDLRDIYWKYFLDGNINSIKHGIFHYEVLGILSSLPRGGHAFVGWDNLDSFLVGGRYINEWRVGQAREIAYASLLMHELGHTLGLFEYSFSGIDNESCNAPWLPGYWIYRNYRSCLNYRYAFEIVDYSDGSHGRNDFDDWSNIDLTFFKNSHYY